MKKIIIWLFVLLSLQAIAQKDTVVHKKNYIVWYSQKYKQPLKVVYKMYNPQSKVERGHQNFYKEKGIITSEDKDYKANVYDKGHFAPAEDMSFSSQAMYESFSYLNCALQHFELNRGCWKSLEDQTRKWAKNDTLLIIVESVYDKKKKIQYTPSGAAIPTGFRKTIIFTSTRKKLVFYFPNGPCEGEIIPFKQ